MNKKGLMTKFLTALILAIIIFTPACLFSAKFLKLSEQSEKNFDGFVGELKEIAASPDGTKRSYMLILDENSFIFKFTDPKDLVTPNFVFGYPRTQCQNQECLVLCRVYELENNNVTCTDIRGIPLGAGDSVAGMFFIRINMDQPLTAPPGLNLVNMPRRQAVQIEKINGTVYASKI